MNPLLPRWLASSSSLESPHNNQPPNTHNRHYPVRVLPSITPDTDRRGAPRITGCYPAIVRGVMADGQRRDHLAVLDSLSKGGLFLLTQANMDIGASVLVVFKLSATSMGDGARIAVRGKVHRVVPQQIGPTGMAVVFDRYRFIYNDYEPTVIVHTVDARAPIKML